jgi:transmembrane sensor
LATAEEIAELTPEQRSRLEQLAGEASAEADEVALPLSAANVVPLSHRTVERLVSAQATVAGPPPLRWKWAASIAGMLILAGAAWWVQNAGRLTYSTAIGEQRQFELADGSIVNLNARSRLQVRFTEHARSVQLLEGQALFKVEHDLARPFIVQSGNTSIQAVGTQFDVNRRPADTRVAVIEGVVRIAPPKDGSGTTQLLSAGENVDIAADGKIMKRASSKAAETTAWRQRRLVFRGDTLGDIAAEFNRYNASLPIRVLDEAASSQHFSGTFDADAPETLVQALAGDDTLLIVRRADEIVIRSR